MNSEEARVKWVLCTAPAQAQWHQTIAQIELIILPDIRSLEMPKQAEYWPVGFGKQAEIKLGEGRHAGNGTG